MSNREEIAKQNGMSLEFVNWFFDNKKDGCGNQWFLMMAAMWEGWKALQAERDALAGENAARKSAAKKVIKMNRQHAKDKHGNADIAESWACVKVLRQVNTPATDAFLRELRDTARSEGIYFTANRLLAAWEHGFIDSPDREVADVARMILSAVEMLPDATDGDFERDFADEMLALIAKQLRAGEAV